MPAPHNAIRTGAVTIWLDDGIVHARANGGVGAKADITEFFRLVRDLNEGVPRPVLFDAREWPSIDHRMWQ